MRIGELTMLAERYPDAIIVLQKVNTDYPRSEEASRSYFCLGDYEQHKTINYDKAVVYYDSSFISRTISKWGQESRERRDALKRLIAMRNQNDKERKDSIPNVDNFFKSEFLIAELFLFKLDEVDSAITRLDNVIKESGERRLSSTTNICMIPMLPKKSTRKSSRNTPIRSTPSRRR